MIDFSKFNILELNYQFLNAQPYHHIVLDNFLDTDVAAAMEAEIRAMPDADWFDKSTQFVGINNQQDTLVQSKKVALNIRSQIPTFTNKVIDFFSSAIFLNFLESITDITDLHVDTELIGGGIHKSTTGGHLSIHSDFNIHPITNKHRRINALLYLNSNWNSSFGGEFELWNKDVSACVRQVEPVANRLVIFRITDEALHGAPNPWQAPFEYPRLSLAFYYYTDDRPEHEKSEFHWALWHKRFSEKY